MKNKNNGNNGANKATLEQIDDEIDAYRLRYESSIEGGASADYLAHIRGCIEGLEAARTIVKGC